MSLPESLVLLDVETTGANPLRDRITEIAVLRVERGMLVERWESLVDPQCPIPPLIQRIIGITDEMVAGAPTFAELADALRARLDGAVFVAHNARFDYGFIRNEFARLGQQFDAPVLCTVKLSRALYPEHHRHGLDALIERHGFICGARHRAMGDTDVLWQFARLVRDAFPADVLGRACERAMKAPRRPPGLPEGALEGLPDAPGVFWFYGDNDRLLQIGRSASLRARVMEFFSAGNSHRKEAALAREVRRVEWEETAGELSAWLRETELTRTLRPTQVSTGAAGADVFGLRLVPNRRRPPIFERLPLHGTDPADWSDVHGVFRSRKESEGLLRELAHLYRLCPRRLGFEHGAGPCSAQPEGRCAGVCAGRESPSQHDERLAGALGAVALRAWPWPGAVVIEEQAPHAGLCAFHLIDRWCHLASADSADALRAQLAAAPPRRFDLDTYRMLVRWCSADANAATVTPVERFAG